MDLSGVIVVNPDNAIERVVAGPGQTFERREGQFFRDGRPIPLVEQPLVQDQIPWNFSITAPAASYIILFSYGGSSFNPISPLQDILAPAPKNPGDVFTEHAPRLNEPGWIIKDWPASCIVKEEEIFGRVMFVYNPPPARRMIR